MSEPVVEPEPTEPVEPEPYEPPSAEEWARINRALATASAQAKQRKDRLAEIEAELEAERNAAPGPKDEKALREEIERASQEKYRAPAIRAAAKSALKEAGFQGTPGARVLAMIDMADCDVDSDGEVTGLDAQICEIKKDFPALFAAPVAKPPRAPVGPHAAGEGGRKLSTAERIAAGVLAP